MIDFECGPVYQRDIDDCKSRLEITMRHRINRARLQAGVLQNVTPDLAVDLQVLFLQLEAEHGDETSAIDASWQMSMLKAQAAGQEQGRAKGFADAAAQGCPEAFIEPTITH